MTVGNIARLAGAFTCAVLFTASAFAATDELTEYQRRVKKAEVVGALGTDLFGDSVNYYNTAVTFSVTDIDIPGNDSLPVRVGRAFSASETDELLPSAAFADWELDIPHMKGTFAASDPWRVSGASPDNRCSGTTTQVPVTVQYGGSTFTGYQYWRGNVLYVPGVGAQQILRPAVPGLPTPADGGLTKFYTSKFWQIRCGVTLANPAGPGVSGEGFLALAPDGTKYTFNWATTRTVEQLLINNGPGVPSSALPRVDVRIYPTRIEDRFGNYVQYTWAGTQGAAQLSQIASSDGRTINFCYLSGSNRVAAAGVGSVTFDAQCNAAGRVWKYQYTGAIPFRLHTVTLPDSHVWTYSTSETGSPTGASQPSSSSTTRAPPCRPQRRPTATSPACGMAARIGLSSSSIQAAQPACS